MIATIEGWIVLGVYLAMFAAAWREWSEDARELTPAEKLDYVLEDIRRQKLAEDAKTDAQDRR